MAGEAEKQDLGEIQDVDYSQFLQNTDLSNLNDVSGMDAFSVPGEEDDAGADAQQQTTTKKPEDTGDIQGGEQIKEGDDITEGPASKETDKPSPFTPYAKFAKDAGVLPNFDLDNYDGSSEGLIKAMQTEIENGVNAYKETLDPQIKWLADNYDAGVPLENLLQVDKQRFELSSITDEALTTKDTQKDIVRQYYKKTTQFPDTTIEKAIERLEAGDELEEEAKGYFEQLKQINVREEQQLREEAVRQQQANEQAHEQQLTEFKTNLSKIDEIVPGVKVNTVLKDKMFKGLTTAVDINPVTGQPMNEIQKAFVENPQLETTFAYLYYATNGFTDFKVFGSAGKKSAVKDFESAVRGMDFTQQGTQQRIQKPASDPDLVEQMSFFSQRD